MSKEMMDDGEKDSMPADEKAKGDSSEDMIEMAQQAGDLLTKLASGLEKIGSPSMRKNMQQAIDSFSKVVDEAAGGNSGPVSEVEGQGMIPMQQGMGGMPMGPQTRQ